MAVNLNCKYYTPQWLVKKIVSITLIVLSGVTISEIIEPSAGDGAFMKELNCLNVPVKYYDLYPEHKDIIQQDYLKLELEYLQGRLVIGNPPFEHNLTKRFCNKSSEFSDYIVFICPASQYNNNYNFTKGNLIYSEYLGHVEYKGIKNVKIRTCLNIYKIGTNNNINNYNEINSDIKLIHFSKTKKNQFLFNGYYWDKDLTKINSDLYLSSFGQPFHFTQDKNELYKCGYYGIKILNENRSDDILYFFKTFNKYCDELLKRSSTHSATITKAFLYEKMYNDLYIKK